MVDVHDVVAHLPVAPILFCKACESAHTLPFFTYSPFNSRRCSVFIAEITARAFIIADSNKRRTLSRADIAKAVSKSDQFDFLIDILPRDEPFPTGSQAAAAAKAAAKKANNLKDQVRVLQ